MLITDGRFSGGTTGLCVGHVAPEAVDGGPIGLVADGDRVRIDIGARTLDLLVDEAELAKRAAAFVPLQHGYTRGVLAKYTKLVGSASKGAVCDSGLGGAGVTDCPGTGNVALVARTLVVIRRAG